MIGAITAILKRIDKGEKQTLGELAVYNDGELVFQCKTLELPWKNNKRRESCIPTGTYTVKRFHSPTRGECFHVQNVPGRTAILIHSGNYNTHTLGCILPGLSFADLNRDGLMDVIDIKPAMKKLNNHLTEDFTLIVK